MLGGTFLTYAELHAAIERVTGVHRRPIPMPAPVLRLAGRVGDLAKRVVPFDYPLTHEAMVMATLASPYDSEATCRARSTWSGDRSTKRSPTRFAGSPTPVT